MKKLSIWLPALCFAAACQAPTVMEAEEVPQRARALTDEYTVFDNASYLQDYIILEDIRRHPTASPMQVQFEVRNISDEPCSFQYQVIWYDQHGMLLSSATRTWIKDMLLGKQRKSLPALAPSPLAADYRLSLREWIRD